MTPHCDSSLYPKHTKMKTNIISTLLILLTLQNVLPRAIFTNLLDNSQEQDDVDLNGEEEDSLDSELRLVSLLVDKLLLQSLRDQRIRHVRGHRHRHQRHGHMRKKHADINKDMIPLARTG